MVPNYYKQINEIPLTNSGKLNRKELPETCREDLIEEKYIAPETEIEKLICKIYSSLFNINENEIGKMSNFYELGGDSFYAIRMIAEIKKMLQIKLNIKDIMDNSLSAI
ncbi:hypothetical protein BCR32DRAFT_97173 [Anaeromyces robustus]|uniref:Carrier domain-containing protein n=1 Tax=Anaeromyces robustus TaxID=1754192 RepID=A0A1Y1WNQ3_9FUNG|nr:hypothetical protein BCR32DRAFT_97173 [Anaeromyces robustus]|eukprot:ORX75179.1 hypothetical protein BCR32DRAFT_97173 [Anaeromyces robustus]